MSTVTVRLGRPEDLPALSAVEESAADTFERYGQPLAARAPPSPPAQWAEHQANELLWVADDAGDGVIGFLAAEIAPPDLYIAEIDVRMDHQRRGVGRRLVQQAIDNAKTRDLTGVTLTTFQNIPWNAPFYASLGFAVLNAGEISPALGAHLASETARGYADRCGMRLVL